MYSGSMNALALRLKEDYPDIVEDESLWAEVERDCLPLEMSARDQVVHMGELRGLPPRAAVRWSLWGGHDGWGRYGRPSGAQVYVMGITHVEFGPFGPGGAPAIRRDYTLIDDTAIWKQIHLHKGAA